MKGKAKVLVTGANGFLGRHLLGALYRAGISAAALVRQPEEWPGEWTTEMGVVPLIAGNPAEPETWLTDAAKAEIHTIVHAAGIVRHTRIAPREMATFNIASTLQVVRAAKALGARVVYASSSGTVGCFRHADQSADEDAPFAEELVGRWPYYASKIRAEREGAYLADKLGVTFVVSRFPVLLGPGDHRRRSTGHVSRVLEHRVPFVPVGGMHFTDVRDVAEALVRLTEVARPRAVYHFPGTQSSLADFFSMVSEVSGVPVTKRQAPAALLTTVAQLSEGARRGFRFAPPHWLPDPVVLEMATCHWGLTTLWTDNELDYTVRSARQTLCDTVAWLRENPAERTFEASSHYSRPDFDIAPKSEGADYAPRHQA